jgi:site-specific recombinase XerD
LVPTDRCRGSLSGGPHLYGCKVFARPAADASVRFLIAHHSDTAEAYKNRRDTTPASGVQTLYYSPKRGIKDREGKYWKVGTKMKHRRVGGPPPIEILRNDELVTLYRSINTRQDWGVRNLAMLELMHKCALRKGEVLRLEHDHIILSGLKPYVFVRNSKYGKSRDVPIDHRALPALRAWDAVRPKSDWFFCTVHVAYDGGKGVSKQNPVGSALSHAAINSFLTGRCGATGLRRIWPHLFRHTCATNWLRSGLDIREVQELLGHEWLATTQRYTHVDRDRIETKIYALGSTDPTPVRGSVRWTGAWAS